MPSQCGKHLRIRTPYGFHMGVSYSTFVPITIEIIETKTNRNLYHINANKFNSPPGMDSNNPLNYQNEKKGWCEKQYGTNKLFKR